MSARLTFLLGRAGTGKTHACLEAIRADLRTAGTDGPPLLFITPEQATFQMERALLADTRIRATGRAQVLSFQRLAARVMQETGGGAKPRLGELGKRMLLRALIQRHGDDLKLFGRAARRPGFVDRLAGTFTELRQYNVAPDDLADRLESRTDESSVLAAKMHDLHLIYRDFVSEVDEQFTDPDELLNVIAAALPASRFADGARIWVDGFAGFTPQEFVVLRALWSVAEEMKVALCLDPSLVVRTENRDARPGAPASGDRASRGGSIGDLFAPTLETYERLSELAREDRVAIQPPLVFGPNVPPRFAAPKLRHLEKELFRRPGRPYTEQLDSDKESLRLVAAAGLRVEVETAAKHMLRLVRERGWRFREMSVIVHDLTPYENLIKAVFHDLDIPYFIDSRRRLTHHPLTELIRSMLEAHAGGWPTEAVIRCLKTDFFPVTRDEVDRLENYALEHGIQGRGWTERNRWEFVRHFTLEPEAQSPTERQRQDLDKINDIRDRAVGPLRMVAEAFARAHTAVDYAAALWDALEQLGVAATLDGWIEAAEGAGLVDEAQEHERAWQGVVQVLDELVNALGPLAMTGAEFRQIIEAGLESLDVGMVPAGLDQVMVGTVERSRQPDIKAAFVLGAADRHFPPPPGEDVIFTDTERENLADMQLQLSPTSREESIRQQYLLYVLLTRASEYLWVSYSSVDGQGKEQAPAATWRRLTELFPGAAVVTEAVEPDMDDALLNRVATVDELLGTVALRLRRHRGGHTASALWWELYGRIAADDELRARAAPLFGALDYSNAVPPLPPHVAEELFGVPLMSSVSRLETFAACSFRHFAQHGLRLREREAWQLDAATAGTFMHAALRRFVERLDEDGLDWSCLTDGEAAAVADAAVDELMPNLAGEILLSSARHAFLGSMLRSRVQRAVWALTEHARKGSFRPVAVEASFGRGRAVWSALILDLDEDRQLHLSGQIDRIDVARDETGQSWVRVIDYKSSARQLPVGRVGHGLALQLPLYMAVVERAATGRLGSDGAGITAAAIHADSESEEMARALAEVAVGGGADEATSGSDALPRAPRPAALLYFPVRDPFLREDKPVDDNKWESLIRNALRMQGLFTDDIPVLRLMDEDVDDGSRLISIRVTKRGEVHKGDNAASAEQFEQLLRFAERTAAEIGRDILAGRIDVDPYRIGSERACTFCPLASVCRFDPLIEGNAYRRLHVPGRDAAWERIAEEARA